MSTQPGDPATPDLPIYQGLLDEADAATRATVIEQQGEGRSRGDAPTPQNHQHVARHG